MEEDNTPSEEEAPSSKKGEAKRVTTCHHPMSSGFRKDYSVVLVSNSAPKALRTKKDVLHRVPINADSKPPILSHFSHVLAAAAPRRMGSCLNAKKTTFV